MKGVGTALADQTQTQTRPRPPPRAEASLSAINSDQPRPQWRAPARRRRIEASRWRWPAAEVTEDPRNHVRLFDARDHPLRCFFLFFPYGRQRNFGICQSRSGLDQGALRLLQIGDSLGQISLTSSRSSAHSCTVVSIFLLPASASGADSVVAPAASERRR